MTQCVFVRCTENVHCALNAQLQQMQTAILKVCAQVWQTQECNKAPEELILADELHLKEDCC